MANGNYNDSKIIRIRLRKLQLIPYECYVCKLRDTWQELPISLQLDHINGDHCDNRLENLRWLCPNCHSQTPTFCGRKLRKRPPRTPRKPAKPRVQKTRPNKITWPPTSELIQRCEKIGYRALGRELGVSDNAIRKRIRNTVGAQGVEP